MKQERHAVAGNYTTMRVRDTCTESLHLISE